MTCPKDGIWMAWLDDELDAEQRACLSAHLATCAACRETVRVLEHLLVQQNAALARYRDTLARDNGKPVLPGAAWSEVAARIAEATAGGAGASPGLAAVPPSVAASRNSSGNVAAGSTGRAAGNAPRLRGTRRRWWTVAAAALVAVSLALPPVRSAAAAWLSILRVDRVTVLPWSPALQQQLQQALESRRLTRLDLREYGDIEVHGQPAVRGLSPEEAARRGGFPPLPKQLGDAAVRDVSLRLQGELQLTLHVPAFNRLMAQLGSTERIPASLDGQPIRVTIPAELSAAYIRDDGSGAAFVEMLRAPEIAVPGSDADVAQVRRALLSLPFLPNEVRRDLEAMDDWRRTLVLPVPASAAPEPVDLGGVQGWVWQESGQWSGVVWSDGRVITLLRAPGDGAHAVSLARALRGGR